MKKIVLLSAFLSPLRSGAEAAVEEVSQRLRHDFALTIITARLNKQWPRHDVLNGVPVLRIGLGCRIDKWLFPFIAPFAAHSLRPDIIHAILESYAGLALVLCRWIVPHARRILTLQSTNTSFLLRYIHSSPHVITAISTPLIKRAETLDRNDVILIPNGIRLKEIQAALQAEQRIHGRILFVGRLEPMKGVDTLLAAFALIADHLPTVHLVIAGQGSQMAVLKTQASKSPHQNRITFLGGLRHDHVASEYAKAEIFCGLSRSEALGNVFLEAQAGGCAVIATNVGGIPDIVKDGETGLLVPPDDPIAAAHAIERLLSDDVLREKLSGNGQKNAEKYDWDAVARKYRQIYTALTFTSLGGRRSNSITAPMISNG